MPRRLYPILLLTLTILCLGVASAWAESAAPAATDLTVVGWNVESGGADATTIAGQLAAFDGVDLWGLSEVNDDGDALLFENGAEVGEGSDYARVLGSTGGGDRLLALYDTGRFELLGHGELAEINVGGNVRASLVLTLEEQSTGTTFLFMVNHLYRSDDAARHTQATLLNEWAQRQTLPAIALGDYNFDYSVTSNQRDLGYNLMTLDDHWKWLKPASLVTTQCSGWPCAFNSVLDFVFVAVGAKSWPAVSEIVVRDGDFPDDATTSDHRPVKAVFSLPSLDVIDVLYLPILAAQERVVVIPTVEQATETPTATPTATSTPTQTPTATPTLTPTATEPAAAVCSCSGNLYNCSDFGTHTQAQACFNYCVGQGAGDIHRLDSDNDGDACESLPGFVVIR